jgi:nicotinamidase-related amidase
MHLAGPDPSAPSAEPGNFLLEFVGGLRQPCFMPSPKKMTADLKLDRIRQTHRCLRGQTALLVVDMQHGFLDAGASLEVPRGRALIPAIRRLMTACRAAGAPVIFTQFVYTPAVPCLRGDPFGIEHLPARPGAPTGFGLPSNNCLLAPEASDGPESAAIVPALAPLPGELVVASHVYDKFLDTPLDLALRSQGITRLIVTGVTTDVCVNCTVLAAANRDYRVTVATDGVATLDDALQAACLSIWQRKFARLRTASQLVDELKRQ